MKNIVITALMTAVLAVAATSHAAPRMELSTEVWNLGEIYQWTNPSTTIEIKNTGDEDLVIKDVKSSCGCTPAFLSDKTVKPGGSTTLRIDLASYLETGDIKKTVRLVTNDPAKKVRDIRIVGTISDKKSAVGRLGTDYVDLGIVAPYETKTFEVMLYNDGNWPLKVGNIELPAGFTLSSAHPGEVKVRKGLPITFAYKPDRDSGLIDETLTLDTGGEPGGTLSFRVVGYIGETTVAADSLILTPTGFEAGVDGPTRVRIGLKNKGKTAIGIESVDTSVDVGSQPEFTPYIEGGGEGSVELSILPDGMEPGMKGYVYIRFGIPVTFGGSE